MLGYHREDLHLIARSSEPFLRSMNHIQAIEGAYGDVLSQVFVDTKWSPFHPAFNRDSSADICEVGFKHLKSKLSCTVRTLGSEALVNSFIESASRCTSKDFSSLSTLSEDTISSVCTGDLGLKSALKFHVLLTEDKLSKSSIGTRKVVRLLAEFASSSSFLLMEGIWREVIVESVLESCKPSQQSNSSTKIGVGTSGGGKYSVTGMTYSGQTKTGPSLSSSALVVTETSPQINPTTGQTPEMFASASVDTLLHDLCKAREASRVDIKCLKCNMSADIAFATAYRRMPKECSMGIAKALAVRISSLLDYQKQQQQQQQRQQQQQHHGSPQSSRISNDGSNVCPSIDDITDLIRVLFSQTSCDFQHFYEILLARRLLRNRFITLEKEKSILTVLPALDKSLLMIRYAAFHLFLFLISFDSN